MWINPRPLHNLHTGRAVRVGEGAGPWMSLGILEISPQVH
jgi:hypothetical protein